MATQQQPVNVTLTSASEISNQINNRGIIKLQLYTEAAIGGSVFLQEESDPGSGYTQWITVKAFAAGDFLNTEDGVNKTLSFYDVGMGNNFRVATSNDFTGSVVATLFGS